MEILISDIKDEPPHYYGPSWDDYADDFGIHGGRAQCPQPTPEVGKSWGGYPICNLPVNGDTPETSGTGTLLTFDNTNDPVVPPNYETEPDFDPGLAPLYGVPWTENGSITCPPHHDLRIGLDPLHRNHRRVPT